MDQTHNVDVDTRCLDRASQTYLLNTAAVYRHVDSGVKLDHADRCHRQRDLGEAARLNHAIGRGCDESRNRVGLNDLGTMEGDGIGDY